jgi:hypothetical protein
MTPRVTRPSYTSYRLRVPPNPPIKLFWSVTVYEVNTRALILNDQKIADRSSRMDLRKNATARWTSIAGRRHRPASRRTGLRPSPAETGSPIFDSTSRPRPTSIGPGRCPTSSRYRRREGNMRGKDMRSKFPSSSPARSFLPAWVTPRPSSRTILGDGYRQEGNRSAK